MSRLDYHLFIFVNFCPNFPFCRGVEGLVVQLRSGRGGRGGRVVEEGGVEESGVVKEVEVEEEVEVVVEVDDRVVEI